MHQAGSSRLGKALASLGCTRLFLSGCLEAPGVLGWSCPSYTWQPVPANSHAAAFGLPEAGQTASHLYLVACPTARALLGVARLQTRRRVEGSGGREGEKQETMREAPRPAGLPSPLPEQRQGRVSQSPTTPQSQGTEPALTLLLQGQLALGLDVLQRGRQVVVQTARRAQGALDKTAATGLWGWTWAGTGCAGVPMPGATQCRLPPGSSTLGEGLRPSMERLSCEDEGVPLFIRGVRTPASPSVLAR